MIRCALFHGISDHIVNVLQSKQIARPPGVGNTAQSKTVGEKPSLPVRGLVDHTSPAERDRKDELVRIRWQKGSRAHSIY